MIEQQVVAELKQRQWTVVANGADHTPARAAVEVWKMYANGVAITLLVQAEQGQFVVYEDVGHAGSGSKRTESGRFSTANAAAQHLAQACHDWDRTWES